MWKSKWKNHQLEVAPLKNLFFLAVSKLDVKDFFGYNKEIERMGKTFPTIQFFSKSEKGWGGKSPLVGLSEIKTCGHMICVQKV